MATGIGSFLTILAVSTGVAAGPQPLEVSPARLLESSTIASIDTEPDPSSLSMQCQRSTCCFWGNDGSFWLCSTKK